MRRLRHVFVIAFGLGVSFGGSVPSSTADDQNHGRHQHGNAREIQGAAAPSLELRAVADSAGGYNLQLLVDNFRFSPENIGRATEAIEGHAHLYVNGQKKSRLYGPWFHLPEEWLQPGENIVRVTLNDNRHAPWTSDGRMIAAEIRLSHGSFDGIEISHALNGLVETFQVAEGSLVRLKLTASKTTELHLHGYDIVATAEPDTPAVMTFRAVHAGRFAVVAHGGEDLLGREEAAVAYVEVVPR